MPLEKCPFEYDGPKPDAINNDKQICSEYKPGQTEENISK
jgi:hypothetical protein